MEGDCANMSTRIVVLFAILLVFAGSGSAGASAAGNASTNISSRLIVLTDIGNEPDDSESMVRLLLYANDIKIEGLVATTSRHRPNDPRRDLIDERIEAYRQVESNLRQHDPSYPDASKLSSVVRVGSPV